MELHKFIVFLGTGIILLAFFVAITFTKKEKPAYFKYILAFIIIGLIISINSFYAMYFIPSNSKTTHAIEKAAILFQFLTLGLFYIDILSKSNFLKKTKQLFYLSIIIQFSLFIASIITDVPGYSKISSNLFLIIFSVFYYRDLLENKPTLILLKSSAFWIVTGIFFYYCVSFPIYSLQPFLGKYSEYKNIKVQIFSISNMALIVMYLFIVKSYLCLKHPQNL